MRKGIIPIAPSAVVSLILLLHVNYLRFVCDDAFISFRYAKNLVEGHGLVYNIGERVEGYSNFLWTLVLAGFMKIGLDVVVVSQVLGVLFSLGTVFLLLRLSKRLYPVESLFNYLAPLFLACCGAYAAWSTGGLETSLYTFLILLGSFFFISGITRPRHLVFSGLTFASVCMTRLDGLIFAWITFIFLLYLAVIGKRIALKSFGLWSLCFLVPFLAYFAWRWSYYDSFMPNTFYVKLGDASSLRWGLRYLFRFAHTFWIWLMLFPFAFLGKAVSLNRNLRIVVFYFTSLTLVFSFYVVYVGGDFMDMFRFLVPILPFLFFLTQEGLRGMYHYRQPVPERKREVTFIAGEIVLIGLSIFFLAYPSRTSKRVWSREGIDSIGWLRESVRVWSKAGLMLKSIARPGESLSTTAAGAIPYYSEMYAIDELGLTLSSQSDLKARMVSRPGHGKKVTDEFLLSLKPTYILGHPKIYDEYKRIRGISGLSKVFLKNGYETMVWPVKISENETKYLYCLSLKASGTQETDSRAPQGKQIRR